MKQGEEGMEVKGERKRRRGRGSRGFGSDRGRILEISAQLLGIRVT